MKKIISLMTIVGLCAAMPAMANMNKDSSAKKGEYFNKMDANGDGSLSRAEAEKFSEKKFDSIDANNDGAISRAEMAEHKKHYSSNKSSRDYNNLNPAANDTQSSSTRQSETLDIEDKRDN